MSPSPISRRAVLKGLLTLSGLAALGMVAPKLTRLTAAPAEPPGRLLGPSRHWGHRFRAGATSFPPPKGPTEHCDVLIVGGGIAGLSAGWRLQALGITDWRLLELEPSVGGNARFSRNAVSAYPWGAHYIPLPGPEAVWVRRLFRELGVITGDDAQGRPRYDPLYLCHEPQERLWHAGRWQEGLQPSGAMAPDARDQLARFNQQMADFRRARGRDGRRAFVLPVALSSADPMFRQLDQVSFADWLTQQGFTAEPLLWWADYCCLDDYGARAAAVSAWAGIHYFASRDGEAANAPAHAVLTWPQGNGWVVSKLQQRLAGHVQPNAVVWQVQPGPDGVHVSYTDARTQASRQILARAVILAVPRPVARRLLPSGADPAPEAASTLRYAPWMVANVTLSQPPAPQAGAPLSWDNVRYQGPSLGYVVAPHQTLRRYSDGPTVLTCYWPLADADPQTERRLAQARSLAEWRTRVLDELETQHPGLRQTVTSVDVWVWGHGMVSPAVGSVWGPARAAMQQPIGRQVAFAHSDMSALSLFEEAQYHGVQAAHTVAGWLGRTVSDA